MPVENDDDPTANLTKEQILEALLPHRPRVGAEWIEIDDIREPLAPIHYYEKNWPGDMLNSLKSREEIYPPEDFVLIVSEVTDQPYHYSILPFWRKK